MASGIYEPLVAEGDLLLYRRRSADGVDWWLRVDDGANLENALICLPILAFIPIIPGFWVASFTQNLRAGPNIRIRCLKRL